MAESLSEYYSYFQNNRTRIIFGPKFLDEYKHEYYSDPNFRTNTNMNNIRVSICGRIRIIVIRIIFEYYSNTELFAHLCFYTNYILTGELKRGYNFISFRIPWLLFSSFCLYLLPNFALLIIQVKWEKKHLVHPLHGAGRSARMGEVN